MKRLLMTVLIFFIVAGHAIAQIRVGRTSRLPAYTVLSKTNWKNNVYLYPNFLPGNIVFGNGENGPVMNLNYNIYHQRMETISQFGDTVAITELSKFRAFTIGGHILLNHARWGIVQVSGSGPVFLAVQSEFRCVMENTNGERFRATDLRNSTSRFDRLYAIYQHYFFLTEKDNLIIANISRLDEAFPGQKRSLRKYVRESAIDFKRRSDVQQFLDFANAESPKQ